jgi:ABC-type dipeptide/oligopeptide/nickel transport system permease component
MNTQYFSSPSRWLPLRLLLGGAIAAAALLLAHGHMPESWPEVAAPGLWVRCASSLVVLAVALLLALTTGLAAGLLARRIHPWLEGVFAFLGRALACLPIAALAWGFIGVWIGQRGWSVETLLPAQLPEMHSAWQTTLARKLWEFLVPVLVLAVPLTGEVIHAVITDTKETVDLDFSLRARGVPKGARLWLHHLRQLLPILRVRMQWLCLVAPVYLIVVEDVLRFMGWGGWMAQSIRSGDVNGIALGFVSGGAMMALLCGVCLRLRGRLKESRNFVSTLSWQPWLLWALGVMTLPSLSAVTWIVLWFAVLLTGAAGWCRAWSDIEAQLPLAASRMLGASQGMIWREHIAPVQFRMLAAWICTVAAQTLLCIVLACAVRPSLVHELMGVLAKYCRPHAVATMQDAARTLADPAAILQAGGSIALAALCLLQISRIVQPRPL